MADDVISSATEFLDTIKNEDKVTIKFKKKDDTVRVMNCTLNFERIPDTKKPKSVDLSKMLKLISQHQLLHVYDLDKGDWRSVPFNRSEWLEVKNRRFKIKN